MLVERKLITEMGYKFINIKNAQHSKGTLIMICNGKIEKHDALCIDDIFGTNLSLFIPEMKNNCYNENISLI